ncbi:DUF7670 domain-containing protein [Pelotomaculum isophthalicicum]|uniref:DUF7670 domain-containing protein n=1 Tax=Pelotomaculum isophthalicicum TaxID=342448 RepID=UPI003B84B754
MVTVHIFQVKPMSNKLVWVSRVLAIIFILFISIFALDAFSDEVSFIDNLIGFLMHLIPTFIFLTALIIFWKYPQFSGLAFIILGMLFTFYFKTYRNIEYFLFLSIPQFVIGGLFIISHVLQRSKSS